MGNWRILPVLCIGFVLGMATAEAIYYMLSPVLLSEGSADILVDREYYPKVADLLSRARESIHVAMFSTNYQTVPEHKDGSVNQLLRQLVAARNRGVEVIVVMDEWPEGNDKTAAYLRRNNIPVVLHRGGGTLHTKLILIDGSIVVVGSTNWSYHSLDLNNEANVVIMDDRIAGEFEEYFTLLSRSPAS